MTSAVWAQGTKNFVIYERSLLTLFLFFTATAEQLSEAN